MAINYTCPQCGKSITTQQEVSHIHCPYCGNEYDTNGNGTQQPPRFNGANNQQQQQYGYQQPPYGGQQYGYQQPYMQTNDIFANGPSGKSRGIAGLLAILVGAFGVHYFYLGKTTPGMVFLLACVLSCFCLAAVTSIIAIIQGVLMLTMTQEDFENKYVNPAVSFPVF